MLLMLFSTATAAQNFNISVVGIEPVSPQHGEPNSWCQIEFAFSNKTGWLARQMNLGVVISTITGGEKTAFLNLIAVDPGSNGLIRENLTRPCSDLVGEFSLLAPRQHLGYRCRLTNHSVEACYNSIVFTDSLRQTAEDPSTPTAFARLAFGMTADEVLETYPALQSANRVHSELPGLFIERFWTFREGVMNTPTRQTLLFDKRSNQYVGHLIDVPRTGVPVPSGLSAATCKALKQQFQAEAGNGTKNTRFGQKFEFWETVSGRYEYHPRFGGGGHLSGCRVYRIAESAQHYFGSGRLDVDAIFSFSDLEGIYVGMNGPERCDREDFNVLKGMVGLQDGFMEFSGLTCEFRQTGGDAVGQEIWGGASCQTESAQAEFFVKFKLLNGSVIIDFSGEAIQPLRRCWMRQ
tara:strand:+ start:2789 stop:4009 length:1221 start_codon:yes stop_codon:yes gene_type:complete